MYVRCMDCRQEFFRESDERWRIRCFECWVRHKSESRYAKTRSRLPADPIRIELAGNLRSLLNLCHPDRHENSTLSNKVTMWLLEVRARIEQEVE